MKLPWGGGAAATTSLLAIDADDERIVWSDYGGILTSTPSASYVTRPVVHVNGYQHSAPQARVSIGTSGSGVLRFMLLYTDQMNRASTWAPTGRILFDGTIVQSYTSPGAYNLNTAVFVDVPVPGGVDVVTLVHPNNAPIRLLGIARSSGLTLVTAPPPPAEVLVLGGDSRVHGLPVAFPDWTFAYQLRERLGMQIANIANGSDGVMAQVGTYAAAIPGAAMLLYMADFNNFYPGGQSLTVFGDEYEGVFNNWAAGSAGPAMGLTSLWSSSDADVGTGPYAGNSPTLEQFRAVERVRAPHIAEGRAVGMPTGFDDGIHPTTLTQALAISNVVGPQLEALL